MARFYVPQTTDLPYHITARRTNREAFPAPLETIWRIFEEDLYLAHHKYDLRIISFVLMPNHFHLIAKTHSTPIGKIMSELLTAVSKEINRYSGRINQNFGGRHYKCILGSSHHLFNCYKYVYQNPLRANLVGRAELWKYSTLNGLLGYSKLFIPLEVDTILFNPAFDEIELEWINKPIRPDLLEDFRIGLRTREFKLPMKKNSYPRHPLEEIRF